MTLLINSLKEVAANYDAFVFDQWGVLHDGTSAYAGAINIIETLANQAKILAVLSNSGKRSTQNIERISAMGFKQNLFQNVLTSGEVLWNDIKSERIVQKRFYPIEHTKGDAAKWAEGLNIDFYEFEKAEAILLMGVPDGHDEKHYQNLCLDAQDRNLLVYCSNPDRSSPRAKGLVTSPGAIAATYKALGGEVVFYGKPHAKIFETMQRILGTDRILMVGDSLEHDIAGAKNVGWDSLLVAGGLYAEAFENAQAESTLEDLLQFSGYSAPDFLIHELS